MQQHPVPQNIMAVEFRLIGNLTIRQFAYVSGTGVFGWLIISSPLPVFIRWPAALFIFIFGLGLAFLPFNEISLDRWVVIFFRAIFAPTQRIWKNTPKTLEFLTIALPKKISPSSNPLPENRRVLEEYLKTFVKPKNLNDLDLAELNYLKSLNFEVPLPTVQPAYHPSYFSVEKRTVEVPRSSTLATNVSFEPIAAIHYPKSSLYVKSVSTAQPRSLRNFASSPTQIPQASQEASEIKKQVSVATPQTPNKIFTQEDLVKIIDEYRKQLQVLRDEREYLLKQVHSFQIQFKDLQTKGTYSKIRPEVAVELNKLKSTLAQTEKEKQELVQRAEKLTSVIEDLRRVSETSSATAAKTKIIAPQRAVGKMAPPITATPNVINGIVKDARGFLLTDVIIVVKDQSGEPVRALKTNKIGQFAISTPLPNGVYVMELEKEANSFDLIEVRLEGKVLLPIEIRAKRI